MHFYIDSLDYEFEITSENSLNNILNTEDKIKTKENDTILFFVEKSEYCKNLVIKMIILPYIAPKEILTMKCEKYFKQKEYEKYLIQFINKLRRQYKIKNINYKLLSCYKNFYS